MSGDYSVGSLVTLTCGVSGVPTPVISWFFNGMPRNDLSSVPTVTVDATPENRGEYYCRASNNIGTSAISAVAFISLNGETFDLLVTNT